MIHQLVVRRPAAVGVGTTVWTCIRIPLRFWKIICGVEVGALQHRAFLLDQLDELAAAGPLEPDFVVPLAVEETTGAKIELRMELGVRAIS